MFVTLRQAGGKSVTGTDGPYSMAPNGAVLIDQSTPEPRIEYDDLRRGAYGGLLYNCSPREVVGSIVRADAQPFRTVVRAEPSNLGPVLGVLVRKYRDTVCEVVSMGMAPVFVNLVPGVRYFLGAKGTLVAPPLARPELKYIHYIGTAANPDTLVVSVSYALVRRDV